MSNDNDNNNKKNSSNSDNNNCSYVLRDSWPLFLPYS